MNVSLQVGVFMIVLTGKTLVLNVHQVVLLHRIFHFINSSCYSCVFFNCKKSLKTPKGDKRTKRQCIGQQKKNKKDNQW